MRKGFSPITQMRLIMCKLRCFYECSDGDMGWAEIVLSYDDDISGHIRHMSTGGRMVILEHIVLV